MVRAVVDANVVVSGRLNDKGPPGQILAAFLEESDFEWIISPAIFEEYKRVFGYAHIARYFLPRPSASREWLDRLSSLALWVKDSPGFPNLCPDPDDDKYLAAAREGLAEAVITGDAGLLGLGTFEGIPILTPRQFLRR